MVNALGAFVQRHCVVNVADDRDACLLGERSEHFAEYFDRHVLAAAGAGLKDKRQRQRLGGLGKGERVLPAQNNKARKRAVAAQRRREDVGERCNSHLNLAIMSLIPGMVSTWPA